MSHAWRAAFVRCTKRVYSEVVSGHRIDVEFVAQALREALVLAQRAGPVAGQEAEFHEQPRGRLAQRFEPQ